jgi:ElaB/YqjD/DUF883 family membrane-anchored ribosome-binding protein
MEDFSMVDETTPPTPADTTDTLTEDAAGPGTDTDTDTETGPETKRSATETIREQAGKLGSQAAERARAFADEGKERATGALDEVAKLFEGAALDVDARLGEEYGKYARTAASSITNFSDSLRGKQVDDLVDDAAALIKKSPAIAVGAAAAIGFVLARLVKSGIDAAADASDPPTTPQA